MPLGELLRLDHDAVPAIVAVQADAFAEPDQHRKVGACFQASSYGMRCQHYGGALRRIWKAARVRLS